ncbi:hypothetical protein ACHAWO_007212 [Cyclotella atomus]|uniref:Peptidase S9 prolyl oligopeptidase catalytic domain-containing protein n=1 Tax=Cyclotella atomus TaxID=382360 RepID=A0ABD3ND65_9STRA
MTPVSVKARDGENIMCYLSSPPGSENKPLVLFIYGGPQARYHWGYHPACQFLCNRGFRTPQVNYRGSTGFGERFLKLGMNGQFYQSVQTDISDASVAFSSGQDMVIFGASFGGYSALWGITEASELYKCAMVKCPLTVVGAANEEGRKMFGGGPLIAKYWQQVFGFDVSNTREVAKKTSPLHQMNKLASGASIQLFHGENDPRAPFEHSIRVIDEENAQIKKGKNI